MGLTKEEWKSAMLSEMRRTVKNLKHERDYLAEGRPDSADDQRYLNERIRGVNERIAETEAEAEKLFNESAIYRKLLENVTKDPDYDAVKDAPRVKSLREAAEQLAGQRKFVEASAELGKIPKAVKETKLEAIRAENERMKVAEQQLFEEAFAELGLDVSTFDTYEDVRKLENVPPKFRELDRAFDEMLERARKMAAQGATREEQREMFAHIPENFWPDRMFEQYDAWRACEEGFLQEAVAKLGAKEEESGTAKSVSEKAESVGGVLELGGKIKAEDKEAFLAGTRELAAEITEDLGAVTGIIGGAAGLAGGETTKDKVKSGAKVAESLVAVFDAVADKLEDIEQLKAVKAVVDAVTKVSKGLLDTGLALSDAQDSTDQSLDATQTVDKRLAAKKKAEEDLWTAISSAMSLGVSFTDVILPVAGVAVKEINPVLGVPSNAMAVMKDIVSIAERKVLRDDTSDLASDAQTMDPKYLPMLKQELSNINKQIAKATVDAVGNSAQAVGGVVAVAGGPHGAAVGGGIVIVGKTITYGGKVIFFVVDQRKASQCQALVERARAGDRKAREQIFEESGRYAKMFLAIGVTKDPPDYIAKKFVLARGMTQDDLNDPATSTYVVRQFLLTSSDEKDDHRTVLDSISDGAESFANSARDFLNSVDRTIPYDDEAKKWKPSKPSYTGVWWLNVEQAAKKNGLRVDPALDEMQGRVSRYDDARRIYAAVPSAVNLEDYYEAANNLLIATRNLNPCSNQGDVHAAMKDLQNQMVAELTPIVDDLRAKVQPELVAEGLRLMAEACATRRAEIDNLMRDLAIPTTDPIYVDYQKGTQIEADNPVEANVVYNRVITNLLLIVDKNKPTR